MSVRGDDALTPGRVRCEAGIEFGRSFGQVRCDLAAGHSGDHQGHAGARDLARKDQCIIVRWPS